MARPSVLIVNSYLPKSRLAQDYPDVEIHTLPYFYSYIGTQPTSTESLTQYLESAIAYIRNHNISAVVALNDTGSLISSILNRACCLRGSSEESVLLCMNKFLMRKAVTQEKEHVYKITDTTNLDTLVYPFFLKAPYSAFGLFATLIESKVQLAEFLKVHWQELQKRNKNLRVILENMSCIGEYPEALEDMFYGEALRKHLPQVTVEGYVKNKEVTVFSIVDSNMSDDGSVFESFTVPTQASELVQNKLTDATVAIVQKLGLNNSGFNAEFWWKADGSVDLIEVNSRISHSFKRLYKQAYNFDILENAIGVALGVNAVTPGKANAKAGLYNVRLKKSGVANDLFDYKKARTQKNVSVRFRSDRIIAVIGHYGDVIADLLIAGDSFAEMQTGADKQIQLLLL